MNTLETIDNAIKSLNELTIDLRAEIESNYPSRSEYECEMRRYDRDMVVVLDGRKAIANLKALRDKLGSEESESKRLREVLIKCKESLETEETDTVWMKGGMFSPTMWEFITSELEVNEGQGELFSEKAAIKAMGV